MKIQEGDLPLAERLFGIAQLTFVQYYAQRMELVWLKAEIAAAREDYPHALSLGEEAFHGFRLHGAYGFGSAGKTLDGTAIFRLNIMHTELVPKFTLIHLSEPWAQRMARFAK